MAGEAKHVVIGGGLAGSMLAFRLAAAGRRVILLEKLRGPHDKVCGEFLSAEALGYLHSVGIDARALGSHPIRRVRLHSGCKTVAADLPFCAESLSRRVLDDALLERAALEGCEVRRGSFVEKLERTSDRFSIQVRDGESIATDHVFVATGKHDLAHLPRGAGSHQDLVGFKMHWRLDPQSLQAVRNTMELFLFREGYGGLARVESTTANLCFVLRQRRMRELGGWPELLLAIRKETPALNEILDRAEPCWLKPLAISPIPYGYVAKTSNGIWRIGDQAAVIPSFTGDGMSIALHSANLASEMFLAGRSADEYLAQLQGHLQNGMSIANSLSRMMVTSTGRMLATGVLSLVPGALGRIAGWTRIPERALTVSHHSPVSEADHLPFRRA
ncbi:MAG: NAD(P)/FAD-dependent oxidoreductase [Acidobacteria bacterium]|nr:NAD(P)/FAD-dependent oxidoreductase [Acidobacteriota bacterium]